LLLGQAGYFSREPLWLLRRPNAPFDQAFAAQRGADVTLTVNARKATPAELAATARLAGVTAGREQHHG
jgi:hypothetical protein